jgi:hypothetical protein
VFFSTLINNGISGKTNDYETPVVLNERTKVDIFGHVQVLFFLSVNMRISSNMRANIYSFKKNLVDFFFNLKMKFSINYQS